MGDVDENMSFCGVSGVIVLNNSGMSCCSELCRYTVGEDGLVVPNACDIKFRALLHVGEIVQHIDILEG